MTAQEALLMLFQALIHEQNRIEQEIADIDNPKQGIVAIGRWLELGDEVGEVALSIARVGKGQQATANITNSRVRELRLSLGSRATESALKQAGMEIIHEKDRTKLSPRAVDYRFGH